MSVNTVQVDRQNLRTARYKVIRRVTLIGAVADLALGVIKLSVGWVAHSQALIADGIHSLSDLSTDLLVVYVARHSKEAADSAHPYGHARFETMGTVGLGIVLIAVSFGIGAEAFSRIIHIDRLVAPGAWALIAAAVSVVCKEVIYRYTMRYARKFKSNLLRANAWHSRSDALSSVVVIFGVGASMAGVPYVDALAAIVVALMIAQIGWSLAWKSIKELVDTGLGEQDVEDIRQLIMSVNGVAELHLLRTRKMGGQALVDVHIILEDPRASVSEGHQISETVRAKLIGELDDVVDVTVHIDPEDDEYEASTVHLPLRQEVLAVLDSRWKELEGFHEITRVDLHYLDAKVDVIVHLPIALAQRQTELHERERLYREALRDVAWIDAVHLTYGSRI